jgi:hypothetical protein
MLTRHGRGNFTWRKRRAEEALGSGVYVVEGYLERHFALRGEGRKKRTKTWFSHAGGDEDWKYREKNRHAVAVVDSRVFCQSLPEEGASLLRLRLQATRPKGRARSGAYFSEVCKVYRVGGAQ